MATNKHRGRRPIPELHQQDREAPRASRGGPGYGGYYGRHGEEGGGRYGTSFGDTIADACLGPFLLDSQEQFRGLSPPTLQKRIGMSNVASVFRAHPHFDLLTRSRARHPATLIGAIGIMAGTSGARAGPDLAG